ncbi:MAG: glycosyltransferase family 4 protein [Chloroflexi bacterium]|nr:glycosyltransferase family 4 protein [Chloroflexota bacterium]
MPNIPVKPLRVGFNAALLSPSGDYRAAGMHRYVSALLAALAHEPDLSVTAFVPEAGPDLHRAYDLPPTIALRAAPAWVRSPWGRIAWEQARLPARLASAGADLLHAPAHALPARSRLPSVVTVHDLSFFRMPEAFPRAKAAYLQQAMRHAARQASALLAVSEFTRRELMDLLAVPPERVHVVHNGVDPSFRSLADADLAAWRRSAGLPERFLLALGTLQPRKNLGTLIEAYAQLRARLPDAPDLVLAGARGWGDSDLSRRVEALGLTGHLHLPGFVPADDLPKLYNAATLLAYPSWYEGFGLPVLEAMACGTPCLIADAGSLPEVAGDAAPALPPEDPAAWAAAMADLLQAPEQLAALGRAGLARAQRFSWSQTASRTAELYREVAMRRAFAAGRGSGRRSGPARTLEPAEATDASA